jgi:hypothetical protein
MVVKSKNIINTFTELPSAENKLWLTYLRSNGKLVA